MRELEARDNIGSPQAPLSDLARRASWTGIVPIRGKAGWCKGAWRLSLGKVLPGLKLSRRQLVD